jgi:type VI secretion system secreted protein VgrG
MDIFTLTCDKLPLHTRVMRLSGQEGVSRLYSFLLDLVIPGDDALSFDMGGVVDSTATLQIHDADGAVRATFHGILAMVDWVQEAEDNAIYRVTLVPRLWRLGASQHSNVFVDKPVKVIVQEVLEANGLKESQDFEFRLGPTRYKNLSHVTQYRESDLDFVSRRLERDGLYYFFEHEDGYDKLIITDSVDKHTASGVVRYFAQAAKNKTMGIEALTAFSCRHQARPRQVKVSEFNYLQTDMALQKAFAVSDAGRGDVVSHDENYETPEEGQRLAKVRAEELKAREVVFEGEGRTSQVRPGFTFDVRSHPRPSFNATYLAVSVTHEGSQGVFSEGLPGEPSPPTYHIRLEAIPAGVQYRHGRVTPVPRIYGTEMGMVDGEQESPYAQLDKHGRYKVQLFCDEKKPGQGKASMWVRMLQPHGGPNEGFHFPLRKKTEVMLVFLGGDPDRPIIAGMVPNQDTPSPVTQDNGTQNVVLTGGGNRIELEDTDGAQYIKMTTPPESTLLHLGAKDGSGYNVHLTSMGKALVELGGDQDIRVDGHMTEEVALDVREHYKAKRQTTVDSDHKVEVKGKEGYKVHGNQKTEVLANREVKVTGHQKHEVGGNEEVKVTGNRTVQVTGDRNYTVLGNQSQTVTGNQTHSTTGNLTQLVTGNVTQTHSANHTQTVVGSSTVTTVADKKESSFGMKADLNGGLVSETFLGIKNENKIGSVIEMAMSLKLAIQIGPLIEVSSALKLGKHGISLSAMDLDVKNTTGPRIGNAALELACRAITIFP